MILINPPLLVFLRALHLSPTALGGAEKPPSTFPPLVSLPRVSAASRPAWPRSALGNPVLWSTLALGCRRKLCFTVCARSRYSQPARAARALLSCCRATATANERCSAGEALLP